MASSVVEAKGVSVGRKRERNLQDLAIGQRLLHSIGDTVLVALGFDNSQWQIGLVIEDEVGPLRFAAFDFLALNDDATVGERDFFSHLVDMVPASELDCRQYVLRANVTLGKRFLIN